MRKTKKKDGVPFATYERIAAGLREFGYPDVTAEMVRECAEAILRGDEKIPHGVIGMFVKKGMEDAARETRRA